MRHSVHVVLPVLVSSAMIAHPECNRLLQRALLVSPGGAQTMSKRAERFPAGYPLFLTHGSGVRVWCADGHEYVDWICGLGALTLGYCHRDVDAAVFRQLSDGVSYSLPHTLEAEVAEQLVATIPCAGPDGMVRFVKTGSEACAAAVRIARIVTGRERILYCGYHGWLDGYVASRPEHPGVPEVLAGLVGSFVYNDLNSLRAALDAYGIAPAAVMLEPAMNQHPAPGFLEGVVKLAHTAGALVIFDEMVTGFRWAQGGAQAFYGVTPDLAVFGKGMANGYPLACIIGPRAIMDPAALVVSGTFGGEALSLAAAQAVLRVYQREPITERMAHAGHRLVDAINATARSLGVSLMADGPGPRVVVKGARRLMLAFHQQAAARGLLLHPAGSNVSGVLTEADQDRSERAAQEAMAALAKGAQLEGPEPSEGFAAGARRGAE